MQVNRAVAQWGVLIYSSASPDIEPMCVAALDEVLAATPRDGVEIAAQLGTKSSTRRVCRASGADETSAPQVMSEPQTLTDFLRWGMKAVPAEHYVVVLGGHGSGFMGAVTDSTRQKIMSPQNMEQALREANLHADVLVLNACLEANAEVALEVAPQADFLVASQGLQMGNGIPLGRAIECIQADTRPIEVARAIVAASVPAPTRTPVLSAIESDQMPALVEALDALGGALLAQPEVLPMVREHIEAMRSFGEDRPWDRPLVDLKDAREFADRLVGDARLSTLSQSARAVSAAAAHAVVAAHGEDRPDAHGISVYLPTNPLRIEIAQAQYDRLQFSHASRWHEAIACLSRISRLQRFLQ